MKKRFKNKYFELLFVFLSAITLTACGQADPLETFSFAEPSSIEASDNSEISGSYEVPDIPDVPDTSDGAGISNVPSTPNIPGTSDDAPGSPRSDEICSLPTASSTAPASDTLSEQSEPVPEPAADQMLMVNGAIYINTGEEIHVGRCGVMDGSILSSADASERPSEDGQSNFGCVGAGYQLVGKGQIDVRIDDIWFRFLREDLASQSFMENSTEKPMLPDGVTVQLISADSVSAVLEITNTTDMDIQFGEPYTLWQFSEDGYKEVPYLIDNWAFEMVAYTVPKDTPVKWEVNWEVFHGALQPGRYRISKKITNCRAPGDYIDYEYAVEFSLD